MERLLFLWDELDDLVGLARHLGRNVAADAQHGLRLTGAALTARRQFPRVADLKLRASAPNLPAR